jgi:hypothetical protein
MVFTQTTLDKSPIFTYSKSMNDYQQEQLESLEVIQRQMKGFDEGTRAELNHMIRDYLEFRGETREFLSAHFGGICTRQCYESRVSACCSKDGIITFFADMVINLLISTPDEAAALARVLQKTNDGFKCVYLGPEGCRWRIKPIVCEMFLCDQARTEVFSKNPLGEAQWNTLEQRKKIYTWPDRPVLFDAIEHYFMKAGCRSPLMYLNTSPGLLRIKQQALEKGTYYNER